MEKDFTAVETLRMRYDSLVSQTGEASTAYYDNDQPLMDDTEYDTLVSEIKEIEKEHPDWIRPDSPTQRVGGTPSKSTFAKVEHVVPMLSLQDYFSEAEVNEFLTDFSDDEQFSVEEKIDGLSMSVTYEHGLLTRAETRGDGFIGEDITENAKNIQGIPSVLGSVKGGGNILTLEVRCEVYMPVEEFVRVNAELEAQGKKLFANPRNAAAGILRNKDPQAVKNAGLAAFVFNVQRVELGDITTIDAKGSFSSHCLSLDLLNDIGFTPVFHQRVRKADIVKCIKEIGERRNTLPYWIDGAVVKIDTIKKREELGETAKYPRWAMAYKYPPEEKETVIREIILQTGRTGRITPVAIFDAVFLAGTKVERATLHNPEIIEKLQVNVGDTVLVRKAAEIIPEIVKVVKPAYLDEGSTAPKSVYDIFSHTCPSCGERIIPGADENGENVAGAFCVNPECPAQISRRFEFWGSRDCMDIRGFGPAVVDKLIDAGLLEKITDIYRLGEPSRKLKMESLLGAKTAENLLVAIEDSKTRDIDRLIKALGMDGVGRHVGKTLAKQYPGMYAIMTAPESELLKLDGVGEISAHIMTQFFTNEKNQEMLRTLCSLGVNVKSLVYRRPGEEQAEEQGVLSGKTFVITGTLPTLKREQAATLIEENGGTVSGSVSKKTDYLLCGEAAGSKLDKAKALGVTILSESEFTAMLV